MKKLLCRVLFWFKNSIPYTITITFLSWLVIFIYSFKQGGNLINGIIAYFGIGLLHLATNLADDYFDYIRLSKDPRHIQGTKDSKCRYLKSGLASLGELRLVIGLMLLVSALIGGYLFFSAGWYVIIFALIALFIVLAYSKLSSCGFGDVAVIAAYGPLMYEGVYYVMCGRLSFSVLVLSFACSIFVDSILYSSMILDYDEDFNSGKMTLCTRLNSKNKALLSLAVLYIIGFAFTCYYSVIVSNYFCLICFFVLPLIVDLMYSLDIYNKNKSILPKVHFWNYPLDNWNSIKDSTCASYFLRFFYVRNIAVLFLCLISLAIYIK